MGCGGIGWDGVGWDGVGWGRYGTFVVVGRVYECRRRKAKDLIVDGLVEVFGASLLKQGN